MSQFSCPALLKKRFGTLEVSDAGITWIEVADVGQNPAIGTLHVPFDRVKSQAVNAASSNKVMLRINLAEKLADGTDAYTFNFPGSPEEAAAVRDTLKDVIGASLKQAARTPSIAMSQNAQLPTVDELNLRKELLSSDRTLKKLHYELVIGELCSEEDFWELRQDVLANFKLQRDQRRGLAHGAAPDPGKTAAAKGQKLQITEEVAQKIFAQNPGVYKRFQENVPDKLSEKEFWTRYLKEQMRESGGLGMGRNTDSLFASIFTPAEDENEASSRPQLPFLDLEATSEDHVKDYEYGNRPDQTMKPGADKGRMSLLKNLNKYSSMVLDQTSQKAKAAENREQAISKELVIDDLTTEGTERPVELRVPDQSRYFPTDNVVDTETTGLGVITKFDVEDFLETAQEISGATRDLRVDPGVSNRIIEEMTRIVDTSDRPGLKAPVRREVTALHLAVTEALRHFWNAYPPVTGKQRDKLGRVETVLRTHLEQMLQHGVATKLFKFDVDAVQAALQKLG